MVGGKGVSRFLLHSIGYVLIHDQLPDLIENIGYIFTRFGAHFHEWNIVLLGKCAAFPLLYYSLLIEVELITNKHFDDILGGMLVDLHHPPL